MAMTVLLLSDEQKIKQKTCKSEESRYRNSNYGGAVLDVL